MCEPVSLREAVRAHVWSGHAAMFRKLVFLVLSLLDYNGARNICKVPNANIGSCVALNLCDPLYELYNNKTRGPVEDLFLRQSAGLCNNQGSKVKVCCPPESQWANLELNPVIFPGMPTADPATKLTTSAPTIQNVEEKTQASVTMPALIHKNEESSEDAEKFQKWLTLWKKYDPESKCGLQSRSLGDRFVSYRQPDIDEYPWMALLEYSYGEFKCGGTLISRSHVLTAAHCLYTRPAKVRLSEYNITSDYEDVGYVFSGDVINVRAMIVEVQSTISHPDHVVQTSKNDVGIIRITPITKFTDFVKPICLPTKDYRNTDFTTTTKLFASGWGTDGRYVNSEIKKSILLPYVPIETCHEKFVTQIQEEQHICAGGVEGVDSCRGDSGGPLMYEFQYGYFVIVGIVSSGAPKCGTKDLPGIYMYVYNYIDWIGTILYKDGILYNE